MLARSRLLALSTLALGSAVFNSGARADVFSWTNITYAPTPTVAQQVTSLGNGGGTNNVSIQFTLNNGATFLPTATVQSPAVDSYNTNNTYYASGGNAATNRYLQIGADFVNGANIGSITVNLFFAKPVTNLSFSFFDVDINAANANTAAAYADKISGIVGTTATGGQVYLGTNGLTGSADNTVSGSGSTYAVLANANNVNNLAAANATATFTSATPITELTYIYGDGYTGTGTHGTAQITALSDLSFNTVPEPGTTAMMALGTLGAGLIAFRRRRV